MRCSKTLVAMHNWIVPFLFLCYMALHAARSSANASPSPPASRRARAATNSGGTVVYRKRELSKGTIDR